MSRLSPKADAARSFVEQVAIDALMAKAIAFQPWLRLPIINGILEELLEHLVVDPTLDFITARAIAAAYVTDQKEFDKTIVILALLEKTNPSPEQIEGALQDAQKAMAKFIRRGPAPK